MAANVNPDLVRERNTASFDVNELSFFLAGGKEKFERRKYIESLVFNDETFNGPNYHFLDRSDLYSEGIRKTTHMVRRIRELGLHEPEELYWFRSAVFPNEAPPADVHTSMFIPTLMNQATPDQQDRLLLRSLNFEIIGAYGQSELGHGTFLRGLETTATYDALTEEFVIHSPTLTSIKWWPGGLGKTSNFAVVMADLRISGKSHGMGAFIVQLRDLDTHKPLKGIELGDIGPKFGYGMIDNGFLKMDHVRVPRTNMLMKNAKVLKDGTYVKAKHAKLGYGTMVFVRAMIVSDVAAKGLAQAVVIATRYSCVRHQSEIKPGGPEPAVIQYQTQQYKVFPELAAAYAFTFAGKYISSLYQRTNNQIQQGDVDKLPELHALSACLKALSTYHTASGIEKLRLACGGHGYSQASGLPKIYVNAVPGCTYEGENTVMFLQTARYLVKMHAAARTGQKLTDSVSYLGEKSRPCQLNKSVSLTGLVDAFKHRAYRLVQRGADHVAKMGASGMAAHDAWNASSVYLVKAAEAHAQYFVVKNFVDVLQRMKSPRVVEALGHLCQLYAAHLLIQYSGDFLEDGYMSAAQVAMVTEAELELLAKIRPNAIALTDAFSFHDRILQSELGRYDGNVYENLYKWACASPLNKDEVHPSYNKYMKPFQQASKL